MDHSLSKNIWNIWIWNIWTLRQKPCQDQVSLSHITQLSYTALQSWQHPSQLQRLSSVSFPISWSFILSWMWSTKFRFWDPCLGFHYTLFIFLLHVIKRCEITNSNSIWEIILISLLKTAQTFGKLNIEMMTQVSRPQRNMELGLFSALHAVI